MFSPVVECAVLFPRVPWGGRGGGGGGKGEGRGGRMEEVGGGGAEGEGVESNWRELSIHKLHQMKIAKEEDTV